MYYKEPHLEPHFQATYSGQAISVYIQDLSLAAGKVGKNGFSKRAWKLVSEWAGLHQEELMEAWEARTRHDPLPEIDPCPDNGTNPPEGGNFQ